MELTDDQLGNGILRVLYPETNTLGVIKPVKVDVLAEQLGVDIERIYSMLRYFSEKGWVTLDADGAKLTDEAVWAIRQHERTYCPYL